MNEHVEKFLEAQGHFQMDYCEMDESSITLETLSFHVEFERTDGDPLDLTVTEFTSNQDFVNEGGCEDGLGDMAEQLQSIADFAQAFSAGEIIDDEDDE